MSNQKNIDSYVRRGHSSGFILIEALLAIVILSVCLTLVIESLATSYHASVMNADYTQAMILLDNALSTVTDDGITLKAAQENRTGTFPSPYEQYHYVIEEKSVVSESVLSVIQVTLTLDWKTGRKVNQISAVTYLFAPPT